MLTLISLAREKLRLQQISDDAGIVQRRADRAVLGEVEALGERQKPGDRRPGFVGEPADGIEPLARREHAVGQVERRHDDRHAAPHHDVGGFRIDEDVELRRRRDVADLEIGAAHHHDLADMLGDVRRLDQRHGDVR